MADLCAVHSPHIRQVAPLSAGISPQAAALLEEVRLRTGRTKRDLIEAAIYLLAAREGVAP